MSRVNSKDRELEAARIIASVIHEKVKPRSVIDVGCGSGAFLKAFEELGVDDYLGIDIVEPKYIPPSKFMRHDLRYPFKLHRRFDLAICLEVAEHLAEKYSHNLVKTLTSLSDVILFSAAIPGQGGKGHVNEQWPEYWAKHFEGNGYVYIDMIRPRIWRNKTIPFWYRQNTLLFVKSDTLFKMVDLYEEYKCTRTEQLCLVHPENYVSKMILLSQPNLFTVLMIIRRYLLRKIGKSREVLNWQ